MKLSIIIVNYNTYTLTKQTIDSVLEKNLPFSYEIMLIDNASHDGSIQQLEQDYQPYIQEGRIHLFKNQDNLGFSKANNIGMRASKGEYILLLNSDTYVVEDALQQAIAFMDANNQTLAQEEVAAAIDQYDPTDIDGTTTKAYTIGALGCKVILPDGTLDHACKRGFPTPQASLYYLFGLDKKNPTKYGQYDALHIHEDQTAEIDCLMGAFMLMPRTVLDQVGLLDEDFFMYGEDIDLCYRIKEAGYKIIYYPEAKIIHHKGGSSKKRRTKIIYDFHEAMWRFYKKHYYKVYSKPVNVLVYLGIWSKYLLTILANAMKPKNQPTQVEEKTIQLNH